MDIVRWGIIGPGSIAANFAKGLAESDSGTLAAIASRDAGRRASFGDRFGVPEANRFDSYEALCASDAVDAIHIATPHPFHAGPALMAIRAGKHVSVEKPAGLNAAEVTALVEAAAQQGVFFMEAFMYLSHPQIARAVEIIRAGEIGIVRHVRAVFGFLAPFNAASRLYDPQLAGGGILDVGGYPVSAARLFAGATDGRFADPVVVKGTGLIGQSGVDEVAYGTLRFANGVTAEVACAVARNMENTIRVEGDKGHIVLPTPWVPGREAGPSDTVIEVTVGGETRREDVPDPRMLFAFEAEAASRAILDGRPGLSFPAMDPAASIGNNAALDRWRAEVGYATFAEAPGVVRTLKGTLPAVLPPMPTVDVPGVPNPVSRLVLGCDNRDTPAEGAIVWDAWIEAGGTTFDTAFVYGAGRHEAVLGQWIASRGVADRINVIGKGAHSPYCLPQAIGPQLDASLGRLGLNGVPIYIMHRDNPDIPVGEFVDAIDAERQAGRIGIWGGSNWQPERFAEAVEWAEAHGKEPPRILNNNLSLAVMEKPVWPGCVTSNTPEMLDYLRRTGTMHLSWSSQARGYFLPAELRDRLPEDTRPETCYGSDANAERRRRAETLAAERGVSAHNVATAWVLAQSFPSFALIGPRSPGEIASTLPGLTLDLSPEEAAWLNLERDDRPAA
ncbi:oxidoreductase [Wenxinia marina]|uniref:aldo/keto reductase n=1 Tax=Wenxinia marina TaxID=390641 RepID=UPI000367670D|nr:aldo/keto reductase [Wenxinia marina]GGL61148.1 oxidoreductase [Wenxinia marina]